MKEIRKFPMVATNALFLDLPKGAEILSVADTQGDLYLWALVDPEAELETRLLEIRETGESVFEHAEMDRKFLGTVLAVDQEWHIFERKLKESTRCGIRTCSDKKDRLLKQPRELPAQPIDPDQLPVRVTLRNGQHYTAVELSRSGNGVMCVKSQRSGHWIVVNVDGHFNTEKQPVGSDVIHVGKWLTAEELEEMRYDLPTM